MTNVVSGDQTADYGVVIGILNLDLAWDIEIERAPGDGTGSPDTVNSEIIDTVPGWTRKYIDRRAQGSGPWHYRWRTNLSGCSAGAWSDWMGFTVAEIPETLPDLPNIPPVIIAKWDADQTDDNTGKITLEVIDFEQRVTDLEFAQKLGGDTQFSVWKSSWDMTTGTKGSDLTLTRTESFTLHEKHNTIVKGRVQWDAPEGGTRTEILSPYTMDIDRTPELFDAMIRVGAGDGSVFASARGDGDVSTIYGRFAENSTPADPDGTETDSTAGEINVASQTISDKDTGLDVSEGSTVNGKIRGENASGTLGPVVDLHLDRFDFDDEAEVNTLIGAIDEPDGSVLVSASGDDDVDTIYITVDENTDPSDPDGTEDNTTAGEGKITTRTGTVDTDLQIDEQSVAHIKARGENPDGELGPVSEGRVERPASDLIDWGLDADNSGKATLTVDDPYKRVTNLEFKEKTDSGGFSGSWSTNWDSSTGTIGSSTTLTREESVPLTEKHNTAVKVRITYDDRTGNSRTIIPTPAYFDVDNIAELHNTDVAIDDDGNGFLNWGGDDDVNNIRYRAQTGSFPNDPDGSATDSTASGRAGSTDTGVDADVGETIFVKVAGENSSGEEGPVKQVRQTRVSGQLTPQVDEDATQSSGTGSLDLTITDPQTRVTAVEFAKKTDASGFGSWLTSWDRSTGTIGSSSTLDRGEDIDLVEKHNVAIKWRVKYDDKNGTSQIISSTVPFDVDEIAELRTLALAVDDDNGSVILSWGGDDDTSGIRWRDNIGSQPNAPDGSATDETASGRAGSTDTGDDLSTGQTLFVKAAAETSGGSLGPVREVRISREKGEHSLASLNASVNTDGTIDVTVKGGSRTSSLDVSFDFTNDGTFDETQSSGNGVQSFDATSFGTVAVGDKAKVRGRAFTGDNQSGDSVTATLTITRPDLENEPSVAFAEISSVSTPSSSCSDGGEYTYDINYDTANYNSTDDQVDIRLMADSDDNDSFGQIQIDTAVGGSGPYTFNTNMTNPELEDGVSSCELRDIYFEVRVTNENGNVTDSKKTTISRKDFYECSNSDCLSARTTTAV